MERSRLKQLLADYSTGSIGQADLEILLDYVSRHHGDMNLDMLLEELLEETPVQTDLPLNSEELYRQITTHPRFRMKPASSRHRYWWWSGAAAVLLISAFFLFKDRKANAPKDQIALSESQAMRTVTTASTDKPILQLADGTIINLDSVSNGLLATEGNTRIRLEGNALHYEGVSPNAGGQVVRNTIITPKGRQYQIILPDGSTMWLNAATTLVYPVRFANDKREVEIMGEAYFEVKKASNWPFIVKTRSQQIEVLGTSFNVSAYDDDKHTKTTLVEGIVKILGPDPSADTQSFGYGTTLKPGQQAVTIKGKEGIQVVDGIDTEEAGSWRSNLFAFNNEEISEVMKKVSRWYDVEVEYLDGMAGKRIGGSIPRFENIEELMDALQATKVLHYKIKGGTVIIMK